MSALATILRAKGYAVRGSDRTDSDTVQRLRAQGISVSIGHGESVAGSDAVIYTCGVPWDNPQLAQARALGLPLVERAEALGLLAREFAPVVAVAGTHGKTTTTAMCASVLAEFSPTVHLGGEGSRLGGAMLLTEACEYRNSFLTLAPDLAVVLNIECDHPDFFKSEKELSASFAAFCASVRPDGLLVVGDSPTCLACARSARCKSIVLGRDVRATHLQCSSERMSFCVEYGGREILRVSTGLCGMQFVPDVLAACAVGLHYGVEGARIEQALSSFRGVKRRWESMGEANGVEIIADYAHHPTQIAACVDAARHRFSRVRVLFQPHTYSRTRAMFSEFAAALAKADECVLIDIYAAREKKDGSVSSEALARAVGVCGGSAGYYSDRADAVRAVCRGAQAGEGILLLGAGDVYDLAGAVKTALSEAAVGKNGKKN